MLRVRSALSNNDRSREKYAGISPIWPRLSCRKCHWNHDVWVHWTLHWVITLLRNYYYKWSCMLVQASDAGPYLCWETWSILTQLCRGYNVQLALPCAWPCVIHPTGSATMSIGSIFLPTYTKRSDLHTYRKGLQHIQVRIVGLNGKAERMFWIDGAGTEFSFAGSENVTALLS